jgi:excisionase family DNA binding protein
MGMLNKLEYPAEGNKVEMSASRRKQMANLRQARLSYAEIGHEFGITKERVRQILRRVTPKKRHLSHPDSLLTTGQAAECLGICSNTARRWSDRGILASYRIGPRGDRRFRRREVEKLLLKKSADSST